MKKKFSTMKLQNRFLLILLLALTISATLFELLWLNKWTLVNWTGNFEILQSQIDDEDFWTKLDETAQNLSLPESSDDEAAAKAYMESVFAGSAWQTLEAVAQKNYVFLPKDLFQYKPNAAWDQAYAYLAEILYPELISHAQ